MQDLPYALYESQDVLMRSIVKTNAKGTKKGLALLGRIQTSISPDTPEYFHLLCFDYINNQGEVLYAF